MADKVDVGKGRAKVSRPAEKAISIIQTRDEVGARFWIQTGHGDLA